MRTYQVTKREGEYLGPVDWNYDFRQHFDNYCCNDGAKDEMCRKAVERFRTLEPGDSVDEGYGLREVLQVGMYDGWPWWKPVPHYLRNGTLGPEWHPFYSIQSIRKQSGAVAPGGGGGFSPESPSTAEKGHNDEALRQEPRQ